MLHIALGIIYTLCDHRLSYCITLIFLMQVKHSLFSFVRMNFALSGFYLPMLLWNASEQIRSEPDFSDCCYDVSLLGTGINGKIGYNGTGSVFSRSLEVNPKKSIFSQGISTIFVNCHKLLLPQIS